MEDYAKLYRKPHKMRAKPCRLDGYYFQSTKEAKRYQELQLMSKAKLITRLIVKPVLLIVVNEKLITRYIPDFSYIEDGKEIYEDVKGRKAGLSYQMFKLKAKLIKTLYNITIKET